MKKTWYLLLLVLFSVVSAQAQTGWITKKMDDRVSVKFPIEPKIVPKNGVDTYIAQTADSVKYGFALTDLQVVAHWDSAMVAQKKDNQAFAEGVRTGMVNNKKNYTFGDIKISKWKTYTLYTISGTDINTKAMSTLHMITIGTKMYMLSCVVPAGFTTPNEEVFLDSVEVLR